VIGESDSPSRFSGQPSASGKTDAEQIIGAHTLECLAGTFLPAAKTEKGREERPASQRQRVVKKRRRQHGLLENVGARIGMKEMENVSKRKAVLLAEGDIQALSVAAACSSKLKERPEALGSANPQALLMRAPKERG